MTRTHAHTRKDLGDHQLFDLAFRSLLQMEPVQLTATLGETSVHSFTMSFTTGQVNIMTVVTKSKQSHRAPFSVSCQHDGYLGCSHLAGFLLHVFVGSHENTTRPCSLLRQQGVDLDTHPFPISIPVTNEP